MALFTFNSNVGSPSNIIEPIPKNANLHKPTDFIENDIGSSDSKKNKKHSIKNSYPIRGNVWCDLNSNGIKDSTDTLLSDVKIELYNFDNFNSPILTTFTDVNGNYEFKNIPLGYYFVRAKLPNNYTVIKKCNDSLINDRTLLSDKIYNNKSGIHIPIGLTKQFKVSGIVFSDSDKNGIYNESKLGINGLTLQLYNSDNILIASTKTSNFMKYRGYYEFTNITPGLYTLKILISDSIKVSKSKINEYYGSKINSSTATMNFKVINEDIQNIFIGIIK
ncbi:hypothetical protein FHH43_06570 [Clostridium perfringens]|nr:hypothetical protein [Clostridium perfringens]